MSYYKYITLDEFRLSYFDDELFRFTQPKYLNDPFECLPKKPTEKEFKESIIELASAMDMPQLLMERALKTFDLNNLYKRQREKVSEDLGIFSLTQNWKNTLMWSHYADSHKGICIGFDRKNDFFKDSINEENFKITKEVDYSEFRVEIPLKLEQKALIFEPYITKSIDWKYEEEIRVITSLNLEKVINNIYLFKVPHSSISEIILGANIISKNEEIIRKFAEENKIKIFKAKISDEKFDMDRE